MQFRKKYACCVITVWHIAHPRPLPAFSVSSRVQDHQWSKNSWDTSREEDNTKNIRRCWRRTSINTWRSTSLVPQAPPSFSMLHAEKREGAWYLIPRDSRNDDVAWFSKNVSLGKLSISWHQLSLLWWLPLLSSLEGSSFTHFKEREYCVQQFWTRALATLLTFRITHTR